MNPILQLSDKHLRATITNMLHLAITSNLEPDKIRNLSNEIDFILKEINE